MGHYKKDNSKSQTAKMRFLRLVNGCTRKDQIHNEDGCE